MKKSIFLIFAAILCAIGMNATAIYDIKSAYVAGTMNDWSSNNANWDLGSGNHCTKTFYVQKSNTNYEFKLVINNKWYTKSGYWYTKDNKGPFTGLTDNGDNMQIETKNITTSTNYVALSFDFWGEYSGDSRLSVTQSAVKVLSPTLNAASVALSAGETSVLTASCTGGSGTYGYTYKVTSGGSDVTTTTLSATNGESVTFTAPIAPTEKIYTITITAKDAHPLLDGLPTKTATSTITVAANVEKTHNVTISFKCGETEVKSSELKEIGESTAIPVSAPPVDGYKFANWTLGAGVATTDALTANPINITTKADETDYTITANYEEDLTTDWVLRGSFVDDFATAYNFEKKSGESTGTVAYVSMNLAANTAYEFKVVKGGSNWYGNNNTDEEYWIKNTIENWTFEKNTDNCHMKSELAGLYTFKIDYSDANPKVSVYYPDAPVKAVKIAGSMTEWEKSPVAFTIDGTIATLSIELTQGYHQFKIIETVTVDATDKDNWYGNGGTMTRKNCTNWTFDSNANATIFADADGAYTFEWDITTDKLSVTNMPAFPDLSNQPTTLYFRPSTNWKENNPKYAAYFCYGDIGTDDKWVEMTLENGIYKVSNSDKKYVIVIFVRLDPDGEISWESQWNQTDNLIIPNTPNNLNTCFAFWKNAWDDVSGLWVAPTPLTDANWSAFITAYKGKTINALVERSFNDNQLHTLCLPFDLPTNWLGDEAKAYQLTSVVSNSATELELKATECATITAGKPYIVSPTKGSEYEHLIVADVAVQNVSAGSYTITGDDYKVTMQGIAATDGTQTDGSTEYYIGATTGNLHKEVTDKLGLRALVVLTKTDGTAVQGVRARVAFGENVETGIDNIITTDAPVKVIENGQLIIIRDGVKYNVQGQKL